MKVDINGVERYFDAYLINALDIIKEAVAKKWDGVIYVGGYEGDGKSEWAAQAALYVDNTYNIDRCVFTPAQFIEAVDNAEEGQAIVYDEAQDAFESVNKDKLARAVKSKMTRIRKKRLFIFIVAPDFWRINRYLFIHRSRAFIRVYANGLDRGFFEYYNREKKHELMVRGKKNEHLCVPPNFRGRYTHWFPLDEAEYDAKKEAATQEVGKDDTKTEKKYEAIRGRVIKADFLKRSEQALLLGVSERQITTLRGTTSRNEEREGGTSNKQLTKRPATFTVLE